MISYFLKAFPAAGLKGCRGAITNGRFGLLDAKEKLLMQLALASSESLQLSSNRCGPQVVCSQIASTYLSADCQRLSSTASL
jgi:hypothetical protein